METTALFPLAAYALVMSITPGPNTVMLAASGLNFGVVPSLPHVLGILFGLTVQLLLSGAGLGAVFAAEPRLQILLQVFGTAYLAWLALRLWRAGEISPSTRVRPLSFFEAATFQFVNPKAWLISVTICAVFLAPAKSLLLQTPMFSLIFVLVGTPCMLAWAVFGSGMGRLASDPCRRRLINRSLAVLTALTGGMFWM